MSGLRCLILFHSGKGACLHAQSCTTLCDLKDCSQPGSSVHGISQARILEQVVIPSSRGSSWHRDRSCVSCTGWRILYHWAIYEVPFKGDKLLHHSHEVWYLAQSYGIHTQYLLKLFPLVVNKSSFVPLFQTCSKWGYFIFKIWYTTGDFPAWHWGPWASRKSTVSKVFDGSPHGTGLGPWVCGHRPVTSTVTLQSTLVP